MAQQLPLFLAPEDERAFLRFLAPHRLEVYPRRVPQGWKPFLASAERHDALPPEVYLAAAELGPVLVDKVKRGPDKGAWRVDEVRSPVIFWERSARNEEGELVSGQLWAELDVTPETGRRTAAPDRFRRLFQEVEGWLKKTCRRSDPVGFLVGPAAARAFKEGLVLRQAGHRGDTVRPNR
jgi:hypothetical protein